MGQKRMRNTKKQIADVALKLFSEQGFEGVSVRDIANEIGIRESAIYKHYTSKQAIFDTILKEIETRYQTSIDHLTAPEDLNLLLFQENDAREELFNNSTTMFQFYLSDAYGSQLRRMLTIEQYRNCEAGIFFKDLIIDKGLDYVTKIFAQLIEDGVYFDTLPEVMALQFYSPFYVLLCKYDNQPEKGKESLLLLKNHIKQFNHIYLNKN